MLGGSWIRATRMMAALAVAFALGAAGVTVAAAADAPAGPTSSGSPAATPPAATPAAPPPADAAPSDAPPAGTPPPDAAPPSKTELDGPAPRAQPGAGGSTQSGMAGCAVWTDRCVICQRDSGVVACSNIGIACQPQPLLCLRPEATPEKKQVN